MSLEFPLFEFLLLENPTMVSFLPTVENPTMVIQKKVEEYSTIHSSNHNNILRALFHNQKCHLPSLLA